MDQETGTSQYHQDHGHDVNGRAAVGTDVVIFNGHASGGKVGKGVIYGIEQVHAHDHVEGNTHNGV